MKIIDIEDEAYDEHFGFLRSPYTIEIVGIENYTVKKYIEILFQRNNEFFSQDKINGYRIIRNKNELRFIFDTEDFQYLYISFYMNIFPIIYEDYSDDPDENYYFDKRVLEIISKYKSFSYVDISFIAYNSDPAKGHENGIRGDINLRFAPFNEAFLPFLDMSDFVLLSNKHSDLQIIIPGFLADSLDEAFRKKIIVRESFVFHSKRYFQDIVRYLNSDPRLKGEVIYVDELGPFADFLFESEDTRGNIPLDRPKTNKEIAEELSIADYIFSGRAYKVTEDDNSKNYDPEEISFTYKALDTA